MIRRFVHAMRLVLPRDWMVVTAIGMWLALEFMRRLIPWWYDAAIADAWQPLVRVRDSMVIAAAALYGVGRAVSRHPYFKVDYRRWLESTPWTADQPLPIGPVQLVWQDAVALGILALGMYDTPSSRWYLLTAFVLGYALKIGDALFAVDLWKPAYGLWWLLGLVMLVHPWLPARMAVLAAMVVVARFGTSRMLRKFPWDLDRRLPSLAQQMRLAMNGQGVRAVHGWPHGVLAPPALNCFRIGYRDGFLISFLAGWLLFAALSHLPAEAQNALTSLAILLGIPMLTLGRLTRYVSNHYPPQNRLGMILRGRPICPGYDVVFVAPLLTLLIPYLAAGALWQLNMATMIAGPVAVTLALLIALNAPPSYAEWALTGDHRTVPGGKQAQWLKEI